MRIHEKVYSAFLEAIIDYIKVKYLSAASIVDKRGRPFPIQSQEWWKNRVVKPEDADDLGIYVGYKIYSGYSSDFWVYSRIHYYTFRKLKKEDKGYANLTVKELAPIMAGLRVLGFSSGDNRDFFDFQKFEIEIATEVSILLYKFIRSRTDYKELIDLLEKVEVNEIPAKEISDHEATTQVLTNRVGKIEAENAQFKIPEHKEAANGFLPPKFLNLVPQLHDEFFGRDDELKGLKVLISSTKRIVSLIGFGGIGKTTLAKKFLHENQHQFKHIAWVSITSAKGADRDEENENFITAFTYDTELVEEGLGLRLARETSAMEKFKKIMYALQNLDGPNLLVIDNVEESINTFRDTLPMPPRWHILITSRVKLTGFEPLHLGNLKKPDAIKLFKIWHTNDIDDEQIEELLEVVDFHTLMTELLAKTLSASLGLLSIGDLVEKLKSKSLNDGILQDVISTAHSRQESTLLTHLLTTFRIAKLNDAELNVLQCFYFLPSEFYDIKTLTEWFDKANDLQFVSALKTLYKKGWLEYDGEKFQMHRLIQLVVYYALSPNVTIVQQYLDQLTSLTWAARDTPDLKKIFPYASFLLSQISKYNENSLQTSSLSIIVAIIYTESGQWHKAEQLLNKTITSLEKILPSDYEWARHGLAMCYVEKSRIAKQNKHSENVWKYLNSSLAILKELNRLPNEKYLIDYYTALSALGDYYFENDQVKEAEQCYFESLEISKKVFRNDPKKNPYDVVMGSYAMANLFLRSRQYDVARRFADQAEDLARLYMKDSITLHRGLADVLTISGTIYFAITNKFEIISSKFDESVFIYKELYKSNESYYAYNFAVTLVEYGEILLKAQRFEQSEIQFRNAEIILNNLFKQDRQSYIEYYSRVLSQLGYSLILQKQDGMQYLDISQKLLNEVIELREDCRDLYYFNNDIIGFHYYQMQDYTSAISYMESSKKFYQSHINKKDFKFKLINTVNNLGLSYACLGQFALAVDNHADHYNFCLELFEQGLIEGYQLLRSALVLTRDYFEIGDLVRKTEMIKWAFVIMHLYTDLTSDNHEYQIMSGELQSLYGPNFEEWFNMEVLPHVRSGLKK